MRRGLFGKPRDSDVFLFFFSSRRRHTRFDCDWSSDVCSSDLGRLAVNPGLTGWAQINGRASLPWPERIELDLWYVEHRSMRLDLKILARTARKIGRASCRGRG